MGSGDGSAVCSAAISGGTFSGALWQAVVKQHTDIVSVRHSVIALKAGEVRFFMKAPFMRRFAMRFERIWLMPSMGSVSYENMSSITVR